MFPNAGVSVGVALADPTTALALTCPSPQGCISLVAGGLIGSGTVVTVAYKFSNRYGDTKLSPAAAVTTSAACPVSGNSCAVQVTVPAGTPPNVFPGGALAAKVYACLGAGCTNPGANFVLQGIFDTYTGATYTFPNLILTGTLAAPAAVTPTFTPTGSIPAGTYRACVTWVMLKGRETNCSA